MATIILEVSDGYNGARANSPSLPVIERVYMPNFSLMSGFPLTMTQLDVGLYYGQFALPLGGGSIGCYVTDVWFQRPQDGALNQMAYQINCIAPYGNYSIVTG
jgi:hypothetical protein